VRTIKFRGSICFSLDIPCAKICGAPVFPGLCFNQHVISKSEEQISWQEIETIMLGSEKLVIKARGMAKHWLAAPIVQFPNVCVLEALLEQICNEALSLSDHIFTGNHNLLASLQTKVIVYLTIKNNLSCLLSFRCSSGMRLPY
jgi:hypothetical protein